MMSNKLSNISFVPFIPSDNLISDATDNDYTIKEIISSFKKLIGLGFQQFISQVQSNSSLREFLVSYLTYRLRPLANMNDKSSLFELDKIVFVLFHRIFSDEYKGNSSLKSVHISFDDYVRIIDSITILHLPRIMDLVSIIGDSNIQNSQRLLTNAFQIKKHYYQELISVLLEIIQTVTQLETAMMSIKSLSISQLFDIFELSVDIAVTISCLLNAMDHRITRTSCIFYSDTPHLSQIGLGLTQSLQLLYEQIIPKLESEASRLDTLFITNPESGTGTSTASTTGGIQDTAHGINIAKNRLIKATKAIVTAAATSLIPPNTAAATNAIKGDIVGDLECWYWGDVLDMLLGGGACSDNMTLGSLMGDLYRAYQTETTALLHLAVEGDTDRVSYLVSVLQATPSLYNTTAAAAAAASPHTPINAAAASTAGSSVGSRSKSRDEEQGATASATTTARQLIEISLQRIKEIYPDYGEGFLEACLKAFDFSEDRVIDALLSDNLPPVLAHMDRRTVAVSRGKGGGTNAVAKRVGFKGKEEIFELKSDDKLKTANIQRVKLRERQAEEDAALLDREYGDDYDDQYDDPVSINPEGPSVSGGSGNKERGGGGGGAGNRIDWDLRMKETKRYNNLIRDEEKEDSFWEAIKNTNSSKALQENEVPDDDTGDAPGSATNDEDGVDTKKIAASAASGNNSMTTKILEPSFVRGRWGRRGGGRSHGRGGGGQDGREGQPGRGRGDGRGRGGAGGRGGGGGRSVIAVCKVTHSLTSNGKNKAPLKSKDSKGNT